MSANLPANVLKMPVSQEGSERLCGECKNGALSSAGVYCLVFSQAIWDEREARECDVWEPS